MQTTQYQGGLFCEIFTAQGSQPLSSLSATNSKMVRRDYDRNLHSSVLVIEGETTRVTFPRTSGGSSSAGLSLVHPYLILQVQAVGYLELVAEEHYSQVYRKRVTFTRQRSQPSVQGDIARMPLQLPRDRTWVSLTLHLPQLLKECFGPTYHYKSVERITLGECTLRRIFASRVPVPDTYLPGDGFLPKAIDFPVSTMCIVANIPEVLSTSPSSRHSSAGRRRDDSDILPRQLPRTPPPQPGPSNRTNSTSSSVSSKPCDSDALTDFLEAPRHVPKKPSPTQTDCFRLSSPYFNVDPPAAHKSNNVIFTHPPFSAPPQPPPPPPSIPQPLQLRAQPRSPDHYDAAEAVPQEDPPTRDLESKARQMAHEAPIRNLEVKATEMKLTDHKGEGE
eukprot:Sspe_Gene.86691::Locus_57446_Transcript_1_1_Confidence_1.000_Length_1275::g.86691::m.86691